MRRQIIIAVVISVVAHVMLLGGLFYFQWLNVEKPQGGIVMVDVMVGEGGKGGTNKPISSDFTKKSSHEVSDTFQGRGETGSYGDHGGDGSTGAGITTGNPILTKIRTRIERAKYYPPVARRQKVEGRPEVTFSINPDGSIAKSEIKKTSGSEILDGAALETIRRAAPLPYYSDPISIAIRFSIKD